jgi:hypothetical protein
MFGARLTLLLALFAITAHADPSGDRAADPAATVRGYFAALGANDFKRALSLTSGDAQARTERMVGSLHRQAAAAHARVELKVRKVEVSPPAGQTADGTPVPVEVSFDIDVVGKRWIFSRVARRLNGRAQFLVASASPEPRIISIEGKLAE